MLEYRRNKLLKFLTIILLGTSCLVFLTIFNAGAENYLVVETKNGRKTSSKLEYFKGNIPADDFYNYYKSRPNTGLESARSCVVIPYRAPSNRTSLIVIMGDPGSSRGGTGQVKITGLSEGSELILRDDPPDLDPNDEYSFDPPVANFQWFWNPRFADGAIISNLAENPDLTLDFDLVENVEGVLIITGNPENPQVMNLNPSTELTLRGVEKNLRPTPDFSVPEFSRPGQPLTFDASNSTATEGKITQYEWDFDSDGHYSYASHKPVANYTFTNPGTHEIALRVTDNRGNKAVKRKNVTTMKSPLEAERKLSTRKILPGETVNCAIEITARTEVSGVGIKESIPEGWKLIPDDREEAIYKPSTNQWLLPARLEPGEERRISFRMRAPSRSQLDDGSLNKVKLRGKISSASPDFFGGIEGDSSLIVSPEVDPLDALAHFDVDEGKLDFGLSGKISDPQMEKVINSWRTGKSLPGIDEEEITFEFVRKALLYHQKGLDSSTRISRVGRSDPVVTRKIGHDLPGNLLFVHPESPLAVEGEGIIEFDVEVTIKPRNRTLMGVGLEEELPDSWEIVPGRTANLARKASTDQWVVKRPILSGEQFSIPYTVRIPLDAPSGSFAISGMFSESWSESSSRIKGESSLNLTRTLPIHLVISRWSIEAGKLDLTMDNYISEPQAKKAIELWLRDELVPYTGGEKLNFEEIMKIIAYQLERKPVVES
ncbi:PKD domain-containing protein [Candidatus Bipolaricaulota bacterium]|nr:PKD domain-containing protein [Candidatus Bipolaricaulota bacterium]